MSEPAASLDEIRALMAHLPGPDRDAAAAAAAREAQLTKPAGALGRLEEIALWLAAWQGRHPPRAEHPRTVVFAANHGVAARGVSAYPAAVTAQMVRNFVAGGAAVNQLCRVVDADLRVYEMNLDTPTGDIVDEPAMSEEECARALAYGMMAVEPGIDVLALGEMGIANTTVAAALALALFGGEAADWVGPGTGVAGAALAAKREAVAAAVLFAADPGALDHCLVAHVSAEPGHRRLLQRLGKTALFDFGMRLGEASGATLALAVVKAAAACHAGMATFGEAGVSGPR